MQYTDIRATVLFLHLNDLLPENKWPFETIFDWLWLSNVSVDG